jgi:hypothetical protein
MTTNNYQTIKLSNNFTKQTIKLSNNFTKQQWKNKNLINNKNFKLEIIQKTQPSFRQLLIKTKIPPNIPKTPIKYIRDIQATQNAKVCKLKCFISTPYNKYTNYKIIL